MISTSEAVLRRADDSPAGSASLSGSVNHILDNNNYIGPFFGSHFYQSLNFRQLQIYYEPGNSHTRLVKLLHVKPEISVRFTIDVSVKLSEQGYDEYADIIASLLDPLQNNLNHHLDLDRLVTF